MKIDIEYWKVSKLLPYAMNARLHSEQQVDELARSISEFGFVNPCIVDERGELISGHGRLMAAKQLGMKEVPVVALLHLTPEQVKALRLADNRIALSSNWDFEKLSHELNDLLDEGYDLTITGFNEQEMDALLDDVHSVLPTLPVERGGSEGSGNGRGIPSESKDELVEVRPRSSDDRHSTFELVMLHQNKLRLVDTLDRIRTDNALPKIEDALMWMIDKIEGKI